MKRVVALLGFGAISAFVTPAQVISSDSLRGTLASAAWPFGPPQSIVKFQGLLARADGETLSMELPDRRIIRFLVDRQTSYLAEGLRRIAGCISFS